MPSNMELYLEKILKRTNPEKYIEILEQDREDFAKEIIELQAKINKTIEQIKYTIQHYEELRKMPFADSVFQSDVLRQSFITTIQSFLELLLEDLGGNNER